LRGDVCQQACTAALEAGYKHIDTALMYQNHEPVGEALKQSGTRDQIFLTTKVGFFPPGVNGVIAYVEGVEKGAERASLERSLKELQVESVDLCLIHNPTTSFDEYNAAFMPHLFELFNEQGSANAVRPMHFVDGQPLRPLLMDARRSQAVKTYDAKKARQIREQSWKNLEECQKLGLCKYIGVANYPAELLEEMKEYATVWPAVNQLELHPRYSSPRLREVAKEMGCVLTGYGTMHAAMLDQSVTLREVANKHKKSAMQVLLRWTVQHGVVVIPRSKTPVHLADNLSCTDWELPEEDMRKLDQLNEDYPYYWDPVSSVLPLKSSM